MRIQEEEVYLTYKEAATELGIVSTYLPILVGRGKIKNHKFCGDKKKYILASEVNRYKLAQNEDNEDKSNIKIQDVPTFQEKEVDINLADVEKILSSVKKGFEDIVGAGCREYGKTVAPFIAKATNILETYSSNPSHEDLVKEGLKKGIEFAGEYLPALTYSYDPIKAQNMLKVILDSPAPDDIKELVRSATTLLDKQVGGFVPDKLPA